MLLVSLLVVFLISGLEQGWGFLIYAVLMGGVMV